MGDQDAPRGAAGPRGSRAELTRATPAAHGDAGSLPGPSRRPAPSSEATARFARAGPARGGPPGWDALPPLCFSRSLRLARARSEGFARAAMALLDAGASANTGWNEPDHRPEPEWEPVLYGAAGVAHHAPLTRLLLERGADANDGETVYHAPETHDNAAMKVLVDSGKLTDDSLATMLLRKADWHDYEGIRWLL